MILAAGSSPIPVGAAQRDGEMYNGNNTKCSWDGAMDGQGGMDEQEGVVEISGMDEQEGMVDIWDGMHRWDG